MYADQINVYFHGFANSGLGGGHWNAAGNRLAGEMMAEKLYLGSPTVFIGKQSTLGMTGERGAKPDGLNKGW